MSLRMWSCESRSAEFVNVFRRTAEANGYDLRLIGPADVPPVGFRALSAVYHHLSPNPVGFELASFRRWFEIAQQVDSGERFVLADSDLVICKPFDRLPLQIRQFNGLVGSIGATDGVLEDGINGGFSIWTAELLREFCKFMVTVYESRLSDLNEIHAGRVAAGNVRASISDMTLLYLWVKERQIPFLNSNRLFRSSGEKAIYIDHNFFMPQALGVEFSMVAGRKAVFWGEDGLSLRTATGEEVLAASLHLGGRYKILAKDIEARSQIGMYVKSAFIVGGRAGRAALQTLGINR